LQGAAQVHQVLDGLPVARPAVAVTVAVGMGKFNPVHCGDAVDLRAG
jgi:hypothetical protein